MLSAMLPGKNAVEMALLAVGGLQAFQQPESFAGRTTVDLEPRDLEFAAETPSPEPRDIEPAITQITPPDASTQNRAGAFALLGALLAAVPNAALLRVVAGLPAGETALGQAIGAMARAAAVDPAVLEREFHDLFIGVGRGEILPYASWYLTGFLHDRPLADLRASLQALGVQRIPGVAEPEDHIAFIAETMAALLRGEVVATRDGFGAAAFFSRHLQPWAGRLFADLAAQQVSAFYRAVGGFGRAVLDIETLAAELPE